MAVLLDGGTSVSSLREGEPFRSETLRIWPRIGALADVRGAARR